MTTLSCSFPGCDRPRHCKALCCAHYQQRKMGRSLRPLFQTQRPFGSLPRLRFVESPCPRPDLEGPCLLFQGGKVNGYGKLSFNGQRMSAHRYCWEKERGPIPAGLEIDHQCRNRACCHVAHLRVVTRKVNATENVVGSGWQLQAAKTHCKNGHPFDETNTRVCRGRRHCRACRNRIIAKRRADARQARKEGK